MPHLKSAKKRVRQDEVRRARNRATLKELRTQLKKVLRAIKDGDKENAHVELGAAFAKLDKCAMRGYLHHNTAYRYKSRLNKRVNAIGTTAAA